MIKVRIIDSVHKGKGRKTPHPFWTFCGAELAKVFSEIINDSQLLSKCYCPIRSRDFDEEFIAEITTGIPSPLICAKEMTPDDFLRKNLTLSNYNQPFLIVNDVGTGKTTYLYYYFLIRLKEYKLDDKLDAVLINLKEFGEGDAIPYDKIEEFVHRKIHDHLTAKYPDISSPNVELGLKIFSKELIPYIGMFKELKEINQDDYKKTIISKIDILVSDLKVFNAARVRHLSTQGKKLFIVLDNVDHYGRKSQERIFSLSTKLVSNLQVGIILSARDYTLPFVFRHVPLSAYEPRFLHLALPDAKAVIQKRISYLFETDYIEKIFTIIGKDRLEVESPSGLRWIFDKTNLQKEFTTILNSLLGNEKIIDMLQNLSDYDMRAMLKMVRIALSSGYLFPEEREQKDTVKENDFFRAIMCGNNPFYFPDDPSAMVINLFDNDEPSFEGNNLIRLRTLQAIKLSGKKALAREVLTFMNSLGYPESKVSDVLQLLMDADLVESPYHEGSNIRKDDIETLKLTFAGHYYLNDLIFSLTYLQEVKNATYLEGTYVELITNYMDQGRRAGTKKARVSSRLESVKIFIEALQAEEDEEIQRIRNSGRSDSLVNYGKIDKVSKKMLEQFDNASRGIIASIKED